MCFHRPRRSKDSKDEGEDLLAPRPVSVAREEIKELHNARILESHLEQQREIAAVLEALDTQDADYQTLLDARDTSTENYIGPPSVPITPNSYEHSPPSNTALEPLSILINGDETSNISQFGSPKLYDARTLAALIGTSFSPPKCSPPPTKYDISPCRPKCHNPPDLSYTNYEIWNKVQKENFDLGGPDLEWKTGVVDLKIEAELLQDYINWVREAREDLRTEGQIIREGKVRGAAPGSNGYAAHKKQNTGDRNFMAGLENAVRKEIKAVARETHVHDERYGKEFEDRNVIWDVVERLEKEEVERKRRERDVKMGG